MNDPASNAPHSSAQSDVDNIHDAARGTGNGSSHSNLSASAIKSLKEKNLLDSLIASKISELEKDASRDEEEDKEIARAVKAEHRKLSTLVNETETELGKITLLQRKYSNLYTEMQKLEREYSRQKAKAEKSCKEVTTARAELNKAASMKLKLETLCRELQKENKRVKEDSKKLAQSEQQKRIELNDKFETTIVEIKAKLDDEAFSGAELYRNVGDADLKSKFRSFLEQYDALYLHHSNTMRSKHLELQLQRARADQARRLFEAEAHRSSTLHQQVSTFSETELELRSQLTIYVEKFRQVEDTLNNSNDLFLNFRKEMEIMTKKTKKLERENGLIRAKCDTANKNILEMAEERASYRKDLETSQQMCSRLEKLCRALQKERKSVNVVNDDNEIPAQDRPAPSQEREQSDAANTATRPENAAESDSDDRSEASFELGTSSTLKGAETTLQVSSETEKVEQSNSATRER